MSAAYKVISLSLGGLKNKVFKKGDTVTQAQLDAPCATLVAGSFIEPIEASIPAPAAPVAKKVEEPVAAKPAPVEEPKSEPSLAAAAAAAAEVDEDEVSIPAYSDVSVADIKAELTKKGVSFRVKDTKKALYALLKKA